MVATARECQAAAGVFSALAGNLTLAFTLLLPAATLMAFFVSHSIVRPVVSLSAARDDGTLLVSVGDAGRGMSAERLADLFVSPADRPTRRHDSTVTGIGPYNINEMLKISFGESSGIAVESRRGRARP